MWSWFAPRVRVGLGRRRWAGVAGSCLAAAALAATGTMVGVGAGPAGGSPAKTTCISSATKCYSLSVAPTTVLPGSTGPFAFTITNDAPTQNLGSVQVTEPTGFTVTGASITSTTGSVGSATVTAAHGNALFLTLGLAPGGGTAVLSVTVTAPCAPGTYQWGIQAKQSNNFSGTGNTFAIAKKTATAVKGNVTAGTGGCSVAFVPANEPKSTVVSTTTIKHPILSGFDSSGTPVEVGAYTPTGKLAATFSGMITVGLSRNPTGARLSGGTSVSAPASGGIARFSTLAITKVGSGYRLEATSPGFTATPKSPLSQFSSLFSIYTKLAPCPKTTHSCSATGSTTVKGKTRITLTESTTSAPPGGFVGFGFGSGGTPAFTGSCTGIYLVPPADTASTDVFLPTGTPTNQSGGTSRTVSWRRSRPATARRRSARTSSRCSL